MNEETTKTSVEETETTVEETKVDTSESIEELKKQILELSERNEKLKQASNKASSEAAKFKRELQGKMTEEEKSLEQQKAIEEELQLLRKEKTISGDTATLLTFGFEGNTAKDFAEALIDNDKDKLFNSLKEFIESHDKNIVADKVRNISKPTSGKEEVSAKDFDISKMSYTQLLELQEKHPNIYNELMKH